MSKQNWAIIARGSAGRAFVVPVLLVPIIILTIGKVFPEWLITYAVIVILTGTGFVLAWRRPGGFMGAAMGAAAGVALPLAVNGFGHAFRGATYCFATVVVGELVALGCRTLRPSGQGLRAL